MLSIILKNPQMAENVGAVARAMKNCTLKDLRVVAPLCNITEEKARAASSGADDILLNASIFETLPEALADLETVYATTARKRGIERDLLLPSEAMAKSDGRTGVVFGCERTGLLNEDLMLADAIINIPLNPEYSSLNLAQAVLIVSYEYLKRDFSSYDNGRSLAPKADILHLFNYMEEELEKHHYFHTKEKKPRMLRNLQSIFNRAGLTVQEVKTLHGVIKTLSRGENG